MKVQETINLLRENKDKSPSELDENTRDSLLDSIKAFSIQECKEFAESIAPSDKPTEAEYNEPHPIAVFFIHFLKHHFSPESRIVLFKKLILKNSALQFVMSEVERLSQEYELFELKMTLESVRPRGSISSASLDKVLSARKEQLIKIVEQWKLSIVALIEGAIQPYQALLLCDYAFDGSGEQLVIQDFKFTLVSADESEKVTKFATLWDSIMHQKCRTALRELYLDSPDESNAKKNAGRALKLLGEIPPSDTMDNNKIEVTIGNGNTFYGDVTVAKIIQDSFNKATSAHTSDEIKALLEQLAIAVAKMSEALPKDEASRAARALDIIVDEASSEAPKPEWWKVSADGLAKAAENVGKIGKPVLEILGKIVPILLSMSK